MGSKNKIAADVLQVTGFMLQVTCVNLSILKFRNIDVLNALKLVN